MALESYVQVITSASLYLCSSFLKDAEKGELMMQETDPRAIKQPSHRIPGLKMEAWRVGSRALNISVCMLH